MKDVEVRERVAEEGEPLISIEEEQDDGGVL